MKRDFQIAIAAFLVAFSIYCYTAAPGVTLMDAGEWVLVCATLGIGHPPGVPVYTMLGHLWSLLPIGATMARRMNLFSAFCGAVSVGLCYLSTRELFKDLSRLAALSGATAFAFSIALWHWSGVTEVYACNIMLVSLMLWMAARGEWVAGCFAAGLALGIHNATVAMLLPGAFWLAWVQHRPSGRTLWKAAGAGLLALSAYAYLPIRAAQHPLINWGSPSTVLRLWQHVTGKQYQGLLHGSNLVPAENLLVALEQAVKQFAIGGFVVVIVGFLVLRTRYRQFYPAVALMVGLNVAFCVATSLGKNNIGGYYLGSVLILSWCFALGIEWLYVNMARASRPLAALVVVALVAMTIKTNFQPSNFHNDHTAPIAVENALKGVPKGSLILTDDWNSFYAPWLYLHYMEHLSNDVVVINTSALTMSWYVPMLRLQYPHFLGRVRSFEDYARDIQKIEAHRSDFKTNDFEISFEHVLNEMVVEKLFAESAGVFFTDLVDKKHMVSLPRQVHGWLWEFKTSNRSQLKVVDLDLRGVKDGPAGEAWIDALRDQYSYMMALTATEMMERGRGQEAREMFKKVQSIQDSRGPQIILGPVATIAGYAK